MRFLYAGENLSPLWSSEPNANIPLERKCGLFYRHWLVAVKENKPAQGRNVTAYLLTYLLTYLLEISFVAKY